jgi:two-component system chemotaxis response regulator CheY
MGITTRQAQALIQQLAVLVVDDNAFMRRLVRSMLGSIGVKTVFEANDGIDALDMIRNAAPDVVILDWEMPLLNGPELVRIVRSPGVFPMPDVPIILLTGHADRRLVLQSAKLGINEVLCKPVSAKALFDRLISILLKPRASVKLGDYYGPAPRRLVSESAESAASAEA